MKITAANINKISIAQYGHDALEVDAVAALWLAEHILKEHGINAYRRIANMRRKAGKGIEFPQYGTELFNAI